MLAAEHELALSLLHHNANFHIADRVSATTAALTYFKIEKLQKFPVRQSPARLIEL